jgi:hypothetical protein
MCIDTQQVSASDTSIETPEQAILPASADVLAGGFEGDP